MAGVKRGRKSENLGAQECVVSRPRSLRLPFRMPSMQVSLKSAKFGLVLRNSEISIRRDKATRISYISLNISYKFENEIEILFCKPANAYD